MVRPSARQMVVFEWVAVGVALLLALAVGAAPFTVSAKFREIFQDFGTIDELPVLTQLVLTRAFGLTIASSTALVVVAAFLVAKRILLRRVLLGLGCTLGLVGLGAYLYGVYSPLFEVTDVVGP